MLEGETYPKSQSLGRTILVSLLGINPLTECMFNLIIYQSTGVCFMEDSNVMMVHHVRKGKNPTDNKTAIGNTHSRVVPSIRE